MSTHSEIPPELRQLAQAILDKLDPAVRLAAARATSDGAGPGPCQQVWCPVCALAALVNGEQHPLLTVVAEHSVALLTVIRAMVGDPADTAAPQPPPPPPASDGGTPPNGGSRYEQIPVTFDE
ncbi:hypothetical protein [Mycolicibacterium diernhoferi]|uniref:Uncharacterized protein n=1 Tax=Mycolicibacterium diernhoferi TaxID=1801 RepID=A0A1Q4HM31_9MYCO|nr:hypothetical protein [Mycolicibacterium diernhoferi]OJZ68594.1 hypothetical protein BRW64_03250 [Mycolicibacterium diernhoferi]OPE54253.1 hypothetical protein BV510_11380 [Mycolicibacterium diernhoferi]PEG54387.1 hypothetical protein CRI78_10825 [Mycolicibacterium diernhoferi]QYL20904.1 hypothetical protein K0O62_17770 [Mycolicibacterium diernhoferi]